MHKTPRLARLFRDSAALALQDPRLLAEDHTRSLEYFRAELSDANDASPPRNRVRRWVHMVRSVDAFYRDAGRLPRENNRVPKSEISPQEQRLADWLRYQRRPATLSHHCEYQRRRLECLPSFSWDPMGDQWDTQLARVTEFVDEFHRLPRYRAIETEERNIAAWVTRQRRFMRLGTLQADRISELRELGRDIGPDGANSTSPFPSLDR